MGLYDGDVGLKPNHTVFTSKQDSQVSRHWNIPVAWACWAVTWTGWTITWASRRVTRASRRVTWACRRVSGCGWSVAWAGG